MGMKYIPEQELPHKWEGKKNIWEKLQAVWDTAAVSYHFQIYTTTQKFGFSMISSFFLFLTMVHYIDQKWKLFYNIYNVVKYFCFK